MNNITLTAEANLEDKQAREFLNILETRILTINERTKSHTLEIKQLQKQLKKIEAFLNET